VDPDALINAVKELVSALEENLTSKITAMDEKHTAAIADAVKKMDAAGARQKGVRKMDQDDPDDDPDSTMARRTAADSVSRGEFRALQEQLNTLNVERTVSRQRQNQGTRDAFADAQAKADAVMRTHNLSAEPPYTGEDLIDYQIRLARKMQPYSKTWKGVELARIASDSTAFGIALDGIRADALQAGLNPVDLPMFQHRMITETLPGGHISRRFVGTGTFIKMMSRPVRHVAYIGVRDHSRA
jgi:hypothetical protein